VCWRNEQTLVHSAGGSAEAPQGDVSVRLLDGAIGPTRLDIAEAQAAIDASQVRVWTQMKRPP